MRPHHGLTGVYGPSYGFKLNAAPDAGIAGLYSRLHAPIIIRAAWLLCVSPAFLRAHSGPDAYEKKPIPDPCGTPSRPDGNSARQTLAAA